MPGHPVVLNGRFLTHRVTGVERFATEIGRRLLTTCPDVVVVAPTGTPRPDWVPPSSWATTGRLSGHAWEQIELSRYLRRHGSPLLLGLCNTGPLVYRRQIASHHDVSYVRQPTSYTWTFRTWYRVMAWFLLRRARAIVTVSEFSRAEVARVFRLDPALITVVPNAAGAPFAAPPGPVERGAYAVAVGSPSEHKNTARLVQAWPEVFARTGVELRIVGERLRVGRGDAALEATGVRRLGRVSDSDLVELYQHAALSVVPSLYEGFGLPVLESQACGCPVAASGNSALAEVLDGSGELFDPYSVDAITQAVLRVLSDADRAADLVRDGYVNVKRYSWEASARRVSELLDRCQAE